MGLVAELEEDQRGALVVRQALQLRHQVAQVGAPFDVGDHALDRPGAAAPSTATPSTATSARRVRSTDRQRLRAIVYSHGRRSMAPVPARSAR